MGQTSGTRMFLVQCLPLAGWVHAKDSAIVRGPSAFGKKNF